MNNRPKRIEDAIRYLNLYDDYYLYREALRMVCEYIEKLEESEKKLLAEQEMMMDDGK
jgi:hypothetical protein